MTGALGRLPPVRPDVYYFNARIRGLKGRLLGAADYDALIEAAGAEALRAVLLATAYGPAIQAASGRFAGEERILREALRDDLSSTLESVRKKAPGPFDAALGAAVASWEVAALKAVARGIVAAAGRDRTAASVMPAGEFGRGAIELLAGAGDLEGLAGLLASWGSRYAVPARLGAADYAAARNVASFEFRLEVFLHREVFPAAAAGPGCGALAGPFSLRADAANIMTLFKCRGQWTGEDGPGELYIDAGGELKREWFVSAAALRQEEALRDELSRRIRAGGLKRALIEADPTDLSALEEALDRAVEERLARLATVEPLGPAPALAFLSRKARETGNIRLIAAGKAFGLPPSEIRRFIPGVRPR